MYETQAHSTLLRPDKKLIKRFGLWPVRDNTIRTYLEKGLSLGICCRNRPRTIVWTPPELLHRFEKQLDLPLKALAPRLSCGDEDGCGSRDIAGFPHPYGGSWAWPPQA